MPRADGNLIGNIFLNSNPIKRDGYLCKKWLH